MSDNNSLGEAVLDLTARMDKLEDQLDKAKQKTEKKADELSDAFQAIAGSAILAAIVKSYQQIVAAGEEALVTEAKVAGVLRATGNSAGYTVGQLSDMANELSKLTGVDDEVILNAEAVLLTFRQVGKEVFPEATQAALDMSAVMGQDLQSSIVMIGKALNDPIAGLTALKKVGVTFNDEQEAMIKNLVASNDLMGAQQVILDELQSEFGGTAEEMENANAGGKRLGNSWENLQAALGEGLIPGQRAWNEGLAQTLDLITEGVEKHNNYVEAQRQAINEMNRSGAAYIHNRNQAEAHREQIELDTRAIMRWTDIGLAWEERLTAEATKAQELGESLATIDYKSLLDLTMSLSSETSRFNDQQDAIADKQAKIREEINGLLAQGYTPLSDKVKDLENDYANLGLKYEENAAKHQAATNKILYDLFLQKLQVDGLTDAEYNLAIQGGFALGQLDQAAVDTAMNFNAVADAVANGKLRVEDMQRALDLLPSMKNIDVVINAIANIGASSPEPAGGVASSKRRHGGVVGEYATGTDGWLTVPSGYPDDSFLIGMTSGEHFNVVPNVPAAGKGMAAPAIAGGDASLMNPGSVLYVNFVNQPFISTVDEYQARNALRSIVNDLNREASRK